MTIYDRIKNRRIELNMTQEELAEKMGYKSRSAINKIEKGLRDINQTQIIKFAKILQTTPAYLMGWEDEPKTESASSEDELNAYLQELRSRPEMKMLFKLTSKATKEEIEKAVKIIETILEK